MPALAPSPARSPVRPRRPHFLVAAAVLALTLSLGPPRLFVETECLWASSHLMATVSDAEPIANESELTAYATALALGYSMRARLEGPHAVNGTTTATIHLTGPAEWGYDPHSARLNFLKQAGNATGQVDVLVVLLGPEAPSVRPDGREAFREVAEIEGGDMARTLEGRFGAPEIVFRSSETFMGRC